MLHNSLSPLSAPSQWKDLIRTFVREQQVLEGLRGTGNTESVVLKTLGAGVVFGELMLLHDTPWSYDFWVAEETRC